MRSSILLSVLFLLACSPACSRKTALATEPGAAMPDPAVPLGGDQVAAGLTVAGKVLERIDAATYSYLRLDSLGGEQWAAVPRCELKTGDRAVVSHAMAMDGFESKTLGRKFEHIVFGNLDAPGAPVPSAPAGAAPSPHVEMANPHGAGHPAPAKVADLGPIKVARASGPASATVAEVFAMRAKLANKPVRVHAKVVKVLTGIMGKNWLHVRDGSGSEDMRDNDLAVTTQDLAAVGDVVTIAGSLHVDRDFGSGYKFAAIVEDGKVTK